MTGMYRSQGPAEDEELRRELDRIYVLARRHGKSIEFQSDALDLPAGRFRAVISPAWDMPATWAGMPTSSRIIADSDPWGLLSRVRRHFHRLTAPRRTELSPVEQALETAGRAVVGSAE